MRDSMLAEIYRMFWKSEDFEIDFSEDWKYVYERLQEDRTSELSDGIIAMCYDYLINWKTGREEWLKSHPYPPPGRKIVKQLRKKSDLTS